MIATWVPPRNRKGYFGFCWTEEHREAVYARLTQLTLQAFATEGDTLFQPGYKRARAENTGDTSGNRAGGPTPKAKRRKRTSGAGASSTIDAGTEPNKTEGGETSDGGESGKSI